MKKLKVDLRDVTSDNIKELKHLNTIIFPVSYNSTFYKGLLESKEPAKLAYYGNTVVGAVCCRIDATPIGRKLYIVTLGCPYQYRRLGIGTKLLEYVLDYAREDRNFDSLYLHVHSTNESAIEFYKKFDFQVVELKKQYYKRIEPANAYVLEKVLKKVY